MPGTDEPRHMADSNASGLEVAAGCSTDPKPSEMLPESDVPGLREFCQQERKCICKQSTCLVASAQSTAQLLCYLYQQLLQSAFGETLHITDCIQSFLDDITDVCKFSAVPSPINYNAIFRNLQSDAGRISDSDKAAWSISELVRFFNLMKSSSIEQEESQSTVVKSKGNSKKGKKQKNVTILTPETLPGFCGNQSVDELMKFIDSPTVKTPKKKRKKKGSSERVVIKPTLQTDTSLKVENVAPLTEQIPKKIVQQQSRALVKVKGTEILITEKQPSLKKGDTSNDEMVKTPSTKSVISEKDESFSPKISVEEKETESLVRAEDPVNDVVTLQNELRSISNSFMPKISPILSEKGLSFTPQKTTINTHPAIITTNRKLKKGKSKSDSCNKNQSERSGEEVQVKTQGFTCTSTPGGTEVLENNPVPSPTTSLQHPVEAAIPQTSTLTRKTRVVAPYTVRSIASRPFQNRERLMALASATTDPPKPTLPRFRAVAAPALSEPATSVTADSPPILPMRSAYLPPVSADGKVLTWIEEVELELANLAASEVAAPVEETAEEASEEVEDTGGDPPPDQHQEIVEFIQSAWEEVMDEYKNSPVRYFNDI